MNREPTWYKDAVIYEVHVGSFFDADADGVGDFRGLTQRLDYIEELGVTAVWLLPFYPSPGRDDGYDIADYRDVHPDYGTLADFKTFLEEAHARGLKVITELVINHTSDQHPWFQRARRAPEGSEERDFYVWSDSAQKYPDARIVFGDVKDSNWTWDRQAEAYYWHRFYEHQPDLNFENPRVRQAIFEVLDFWMEMGVDGMRLDAVTYLFEEEGTDCESLPQTHEFLRRLRAHVDEHYDERMLLAEANQWPEDAVDYYGEGDECHMTFHFPLMPRMFMAVEMEDRFPIIDIVDQTPEIPETCQWAVFLRNHDELTLEMVTDEERDFMYRRYAPEMRMRFNLGIRRRLAPLMKGDRRKIELMYGLLLSVIGTPVIYYGDELGMGDNYHLGDRDGVRTPMQWNADQNAGFSEANPQSLHLPVIHDPEYHYVSTNVEVQEGRPSSFLSWLKRLIAVRREHPAFGRGELEFLETGNHRVVAYRRRFDGGRGENGDEDRPDVVVAVMNLSRTAQHATLKLSDYSGWWPVEMVGQTRFPRLDGEGWSLTLSAYGFHWFSLAEQPPDLDDVIHRSGPFRRPLSVQSRWEEVFEGRRRSQFTEMLGDYILERDWFQPRGQRLEDVQIVETVPVQWEDGQAFITLVQTRFSNAESDIYVVPVTATRCEQDEQPSFVAALPEESRIGRVGCDQTGGEYLLYDALRHPAFGKRLLEWVTRRREIQGTAGQLRGTCEAGFDGWLDSDHAGTDAEPAVNPARQTHTTLIFDEDVVLKVFRRLDDRVSLDMEVGRYLTETGFDHAPRLLGHLSYVRGRWEPVTLAVVNAYISHAETAASGARRWIEARLDGGQVAEAGESDEDGRFGSLALMGLTESAGEGAEGGEGIEAGGDGSEASASWRALLSHLGRRTAGFHGRMGGVPADSSLSPEPFTRSYQRSRYQWMRGIASRAFRALVGHLEELPDESRRLAESLLDHRDGIFERFGALVGRGIGGRRIRIHGDLHFGQFLVTDDDVAIIDFEGRPGTPTGERRIKRSALRDVSALLTDLLVLVQQSLRERDGGAAGESRREVAHELVCEASAELLASYFEEAGRASYLPGEALASSTFLDALRLEQGLRRVQEELEAGRSEVGFLLRQLVALVDSSSPSSPPPEDSSRTDESSRTDKSSQTDESS